MVRGSVQESSGTWLLLTSAVVPLLKKEVLQKRYASRLNITFTIRWANTPTTFFSGGQIMAFHFE